MDINVTPLETFHDGSYEIKEAPHRRTSGRVRGTNGKGTERG